MDNLVFGRLPHKSPQGISARRDAIVPGPGRSVRNQERPGRSGDALTLALEQRVDNISPVLLRAGKVMGAKRVDAFCSVILPAALPSFVGGLVQGWALASRSLLAGEIIGGIAGYSLGQQLAANDDLVDAAAV
jgi:Binding-protein-dependent transport system inner membrane component